MVAPLHLTKIAFGAKSYADIESWFAGRQRVSLTTRYCPKRVEELAGGSLYWIHDHALVARTPMTGFTQLDSGKWSIDLEPRLIRVHSRPKRAHQGWRYLADADAPPDLADGEDAGDALPGRLLGKLTKLGLV